MEMSLKQVEEMQFIHQKLGCQILPPLVMDDKGIRRSEKYVGATNLKLENGRYWRNLEEISTIIIPVSCQSNVRKCQNQLILKIEKDSREVEVNDTRRQIGSLVVLQKHLDQLNYMVKDTVGGEFEIKKLASKVDTNQVSEPVDCGVMAIIIANHLALELQGEPIFQIFSNDWLRSHRYYLMFNLELGFTKMEIGKSGHSVREEESELSIDKKSSLLWK
ncbi:hypothetical protein OXYTRIMIC_292 [Oxytricha trifallax]|uniref:Ubiquitin-like protease family profile domain-containing protein n=1 Tax=Oxytricha trifallax TaxID=1172189 RepID=A0A073IBA0_9SPIT|nr:hypothetical protein OXYTRIMIC_292 [Oxytricha trifallax]